MSFAARRGFYFIATAAAATLYGGGQALACDGHVCTPSSCFALTYDPTHTHASNAGTADTRGGTLNSNPIGLNMTLMSQVTLAQMGGGSGSSLYGWVDPATKREYAIMGRSTGTSIVDISNPRAPKVVGNIPSAGSNTQWREPKVYGNWVYIGVDGGTHRMQYADLTQVRNYTGTTLTLNSATFNGTYTNSVGSQTFVTQIHTLQVNPDSGYLYLSGTNSSINSGAPIMVDVRNPGTPLAAGKVTNADGYSHENAVVTYRGPDAQHFGKEIMLSSNGKQGGVDTFSIVDVTNKASTARLSSKTYASAGYIHQGWLTEDHKYFFMNDELDETGGQTGGKTRTHLWDVQDLDNPTYRGFVDLATGSVDHNMYVKDGFLFETNYTTGIRMFKIGDLASNDKSQWITEVAYYDTYAPNDGASFNGAWNNYPYFPSGNIAVSDINGGLFVVQPNVAGWTLNPWDPRGGGNGGNPVNAPEPTAAGAILGVASLAVSRRRR